MTKRLGFVLAGVLWMLAACGVAAVAQRPGGGQGQGGQGQQGQGGQGGGQLRSLVPPGVDWILGYSVDNSIIAHDPPVEDPNAPPRVLVKGQWLDMLRTGTANAVRKFHALESSPTILTAGEVGDVKVKTPAKLATFPMRLLVDKEGVITFTLYSPEDPGKIVYRVTKKDDLRVGDSIVVSGIIAPQADGGQRESYLQFTFAAAPKAVDAEPKSESKQPGDKGK